jgi:hypothetical protein
MVHERIINSVLYNKYNNIIEIYKVQNYWGILYFVSPASRSTEFGDPFVPNFVLSQVVHSMGFLPEVQNSTCFRSEVAVSKDRHGMGLVVSYGARHFTCGYKPTFVQD